MDKREMQVELRFEMGGKPATEEEVRKALWDKLARSELFARRVNAVLESDDFRQWQAERRSKRKVTA